MTNRARRTNGPTEEDLRRAKKLGEELRKKLPAEFTVAARPARVGEPQLPDLHFKADADIPGLYYAPVDPDYIMARTREPTGIKVGP